MKSESLFVESSMSWVYGYNLETKSSRHFPYNDNPTRALNTTSLKCYLSSTKAIDRQKSSRMRMKAQSRLMQERFIEIHQVFAKYVGYFLTA